jgi:hypothetical protein
MEDWNRLTERLFWYSKRAPDVAAIQAEGAVNEILAAPEISSALQTADRLGKTAENVPLTVKTEREALFSQLESHHGMLTEVLADVRRITADVDSVVQASNVFATNLQQALVTVDILVCRLGLDKPGVRPFDIQDYLATLTRLDAVVTKLQQLVLGIDQLARSEGWRRSLDDMAELTDRRLDGALVRICLALGAAFLLAVLYRVVSLRLQRQVTRTIREQS